MRSLLTLLLAITAPAAAIVTAVLAQFALQTVWPGVMNISLDGLSVDSYLTVVVMRLLSVLVGVWLRRRGPNRSSQAASFVAPIIWFIAILLTKHPARALSSMETFLLLAGAVAPLVALAAGLRWEGRVGVAV